VKKIGLSQALSRMMDKDYIYKDDSNYYKPLDPVLRYLYENNY